MVDRSSSLDRARTELPRRRSALVTDGVRVPSEEGSALQKRRCIHAQTHRGRRGLPSADDTSIKLTSDDGAIAFILKPRGPGLLVERTQHGPLGTFIVLCMVLHNRAAFSRWADTEPARFDHPLLFSQLKRQGDEYFRQPG